MKKCTGCNESYPETNEYFSNYSRSEDGLRSYCKRCVKEQGSIYYRKNKDIINEKAKTYRSKHKEAIHKRGKLYYEGNRETIINKHMDWYEKNKMTFTEYHKKWYEENKANVSSKAKSYREHNKEKCKVFLQRYKAKKLLLPSTLTVEQWEKIKLDFNNRCAYCGSNKQLAQEHFVAVSKGGEYSHNNIVPACKSCNSSKSDKSFFVWYPKFKHYSKQRETKILGYLNYDKNNVQQLALL